MFALFSKYLGDQWTVGDYAGLAASAGDELPPRIAMLAAMMPTIMIAASFRGASLSAKEKRSRFAFL